MRLAPLLALALTPLLHAGERLDPGSIARDYAAGGSGGECPRLQLWLPGAAKPEPLPLLVPRPTLAELVAAEAEHRPPPREVRKLEEDDSEVDPSLLRAVGFEAERGFWIRIAQLQSQLFLDLGAYDGREQTLAQSEHWSGLEAGEERGKTFALADGAVLGDLRISLGAVGSEASVAQVLEGEATLVQLNPLRDVTAQLDLAFISLPRGLRKRLPPPLMIVRISAAYLDAFARVSSGSNNTGGIEVNSEVGLAVGMSW